jgi:hypothetical protein
MSFFKTFPVTERCRIQFRAESFNFANHTNLANPNSCVDARVSLDAFLERSRIMSRGNGSSR